VVEMPVLLRPVDIDDAGNDVIVTLGEGVTVNPVLALELRSRGIEPSAVQRPLDLPMGTQFDPRPVWSNIEDAVGERMDGFEMSDRLVLGAFDDPEQRLVDDLDHLGPVLRESSIIAAVAGDAQALTDVAEPLPDVPATDRDPLAERGLGDLDDRIFAALDLVARGRHLFLQAPPGANVSGTVAAIVADAAATGRRSLVVGGALGALDEVALKLAE